MTWPLDFALWWRVDDHVAEGVNRDEWVVFFAGMRH